MSATDQTPPPNTPEPLQTPGGTPDVTPKGNEAAESSTRGFLVIAGAKVFFILTGFAIKFSLPYLFESPAEFGFYETAMGAISILNMVLIVSTIQTVSKFVSERENNAGAVLRQGLLFQLVVGGTLGAAVFAGAPAVASFLEDDALASPLRVAALVVLAYALYGAVVGALNGLRQFTSQAKLDATFSLLRSTGIIGGAALGLGAVGALSGFATAAVAILLVGLFTVRKLLRAPAVLETEALQEMRGEQSQLTKPSRFPVPLARWLQFLAPIWLYQSALNGCLQIDVLVLKKTYAELVLASGASATLAAELASEHVGYYRAAQTFAFVPYQLILAVTFIIFPLVSRATSSGDEDSARTAVRSAMRFSLLVLLAVAAPISGAALGVIDIAYPTIYATEGAAALEVLSFGLVAFALFVIAATILTSAGKPGSAAAVACFSVVALVVAGRLSMQAVGTEGALMALATSTTSAMYLALLLCGAVLFRRFRTFIPIATVVRAVFAAAAAWWTAHACLAWLAGAQSPQILHTLAALIAGGLVFLAVLFIMRELRVAELKGLIRARGKTTS